MICVAYHSQLEISFLMDEFAMPPTLTQNPSFHSLIEGQEDEGASQEPFSGSPLPREPDFPPDFLPSDDGSLLETRILFEKGDQENKSVSQDVASLKPQEHAPAACPMGAPCALFPSVPESLLPLHVDDQQDA